MLASVRRICEAGNKVVMHATGGSIENEASGGSIPVVFEKGVYYLELELQGFARQD